MGPGADSSLFGWVSLADGFLWPGLPFGPRGPQPLRLETWGPQFGLSDNVTPTFVFQRFYFLIRLLTRCKNKLYTMHIMLKPALGFSDEHHQMPFSRWRQNYPSPWLHHTNVPHAIQKLWLRAHHICSQKTFSSHKTNDVNTAYCTNGSLVLKSGRDDGPSFERHWSDMSSPRSCSRRFQWKTNAFGAEGNDIRSAHLDITLTACPTCPHCYTPSTRLHLMCAPELPKKDLIHLAEWIRYMYHLQTWLSSRSMPLTGIVLPALSSMGWAACGFSVPPSRVNEIMFSPLQWDGVSNYVNMDSRKHIKLESSHALQHTLIRTFC